MSAILKLTIIWVLSSWFALSASANVIEIYPSVAKAGITNYDLPTIKVSGSNRGVYSRVDNDILFIWVTAKGHAPARAKNDGETIIKVNGLSREIDKPGDPKTYKIEFPYVPPTSNDGHKAVSPIDICNNEVERRYNRKDRNRYIKKGGTVRLLQAYKVEASSAWETRPKKKVGFNDPSPDVWYDEFATPALIKCLPTNFAKTSKKTSTSSNSAALRDALNKKESSQTKTEKKGTRVNPEKQTGQATRSNPDKAKRANPHKAKRKISFRVEPMAFKRISGSRCPSKVRLVGRIDVDKRFEGLAFFTSPQWFSAKSAVKLKPNSGRNITSVYPLDWAPKKVKAFKGSSAIQAASQTIDIRMNLVNQQGKRVRTKHKNLVVTCK